MAFNRSQFESQEEELSFCGIGIIGSSVVLWDENAISENFYHGYRLDMVSPDSDLSRVKPPIVAGDVLVAMKDERYGKEWIPMRMVRFKEKLPNGMVPRVLGPEDTMVELRIRRAADDKIVEVQAWRKAFEHVYDPKHPDEVIGLRKAYSSVRGCALTQIEPLGLPKLAWAEAEGLSSVQARSVLPVEEGAVRRQAAVR